MNKFLFLLGLFLPVLGLTSCVHRVNNAYTTDTVRVDTIERDNDFPVDTAPVKVDSLPGDSTSKVDSSSLVTPIKSDMKK